MDDALKKKLEKLANGTDVIIANPDDIEKLKEQGLPIRIVPSKTITELFEERLKSATEVAKHLPTLPHKLPPAIKSLYQEIRECIFFGLNGAAITLAGNLIEFTLKHTTYVKEVGGYQRYDSSKWDEFEKIAFGEAINRAKKSRISRGSNGKTTTVLSRGYSESIQSLQYKEDNQGRNRWKGKKGYFVDRRNR